MAIENGSYWPRNIRGLTYTLEDTPVSPENGDTWFHPGLGILRAYINNEWKVIYNGGIASGYSVGGYSGLSKITTIEKLQFPADTMVSAGNLLTAVQDAYGFNSTKEGFICGGSETTTSDDIRTMSFPHDSGSATVIGSLSSSTYGNCSLNSSAIGYCLGGSGGLLWAWDVDLATYATTTDMTFLLMRGDESTGVNSSLKGFQIGGFSATGIDGFDFATETCYNVGLIGTGVHDQGCGCNSSQAAYVAGSDNIDRVAKFQFPTETMDTLTTTLGTMKWDMTSFNSTQHGYFFGGTVGWANFAQIYKLSFPFYSASQVANVGYLSAARHSATGIDNTDFVSMFV